MHAVFYVALRERKKRLSISSITGLRFNFDAGAGLSNKNSHANAGAMI
jgi:hypothetical protein